eukprot:1149169-Pelagomonas_calceolata.AAC.6
MVAGGEGMPRVCFWRRACLGKARAQFAGAEVNWHARSCDLSDPQPKELAESTGVVGRAGANMSAGKLAAKQAVSEGACTPMCLITFAAQECFGEARAESMLPSMGPSHVILHACCHHGDANQCTCSQSAKHALSSGKVRQGCIAIPAGLQGQLSGNAEACDQTWSRNAQAKQPGH